MAESLNPICPPLLATDVKPEWIERCKQACARPQVEVRVNGRCIEARYADSTVSWQPIMLQHGGIFMASERDADEIYLKITQ